MDDNIMDCKDAKNGKVALLQQNRESFPPAERELAEANAKCIRERGG
jgi:hypothetical protein